VRLCLKDQPQHLTTARIFVTPGRCGWCCAHSRAPLNQDTTELFTALPPALISEYYRGRMNRPVTRLFLIAFFLLALPLRSPAPLIYTPGEGWIYEPYGGEPSWRRNRAKDQLVVAQQAFDQKDYSVALKAAKRTVKVWPLSDYAPQAQYIVGRCYEAKGYDEKAFKAYQQLIEKYPRAPNYDDVLKRQFEIANRFLAGQWFKLFGYIPFFPSMDKTADLYAKIVKNGPYSDIAPQAQMNIGQARINQKNYPDAVKAYERAADRYNDRPKIAADAVYNMALAYGKQAQTAEYDQGTAGQAIATFTDFITLYPDDPRTAEAQKYIASLRSEQARGNFEIAKYYDRIGKMNGALVYYNEVLVRDPNSPFATQARERIDAIKRRIQTASR
jgi:outer membrane protein assembly factor BamD